MGKKRGKGIYTYSSGERYEGEMGGMKGYKHGQVTTSSRGWEGRGGEGGRGGVCLWRCWLTLRRAAPTLIALPPALAHPPTHPAPGLPVRLADRAGCTRKTVR